MRRIALTSGIIFAGMNKRSDESMQDMKISLTDNRAATGGTGRLIKSVEADWGGPKWGSGS